MLFSLKLLLAKYEFLVKEVALSASLGIDLLHDWFSDKEKFF